MHVIEEKITGFKVVEKVSSTETVQDKVDQNTPTDSSCINHESIEQMHENIDRPEALVGSTYKLKTPMSEHALYITINDLLLNPNTHHEHIRPFEIFINSKNMDNFQWVVALTRVISAVFRKGGDVTFLVEELKAVFDPKGGYFKKGKFMPSLVADIGQVIETHLKTIGLIETESLSSEQIEFLEKKKSEFKHLNASNNQDESTSEFPNNAQLCNRCYTKAVIKLDGCMTCLSCGDSKCG